MADRAANSRKEQFATTRRNVTSYDVARHAGVSQSAVSRCFKPGASVSKKMRERVMKAVKELGYQPNAIARGLITRRSNMVGVIVSNLNFYPEVLSELSARFTERGVHVLLFTLDHESDVARTLEGLDAGDVDRMIAPDHHRQRARAQDRAHPGGDVGMTLQRIGMHDIGVAQIHDPHGSRQVGRVILVVVSARMAKAKERRGLAHSARPEPPLSSL